MNETSKVINPNLKFRKALGRTYLNEDRLRDAVEVFLGILRDEPEDVDTLLELGNLYLASGNGRTAARLFRRVLELAPERTIIQRQLQLAENEEESVLQEEPVPTDPAAISRLLQRLTGENEPIPEPEILQAYEMLQRILNSPNPGEEVASHLDDIGNLLPALIEINIRQARADGQASVAEALQNVQINIAFQKSSQDPQSAQGGAGTSGKTMPKKAHRVAIRHHFKGNVLMLLPDIRCVSERMSFVYNALALNGCKVVQAEEFRRDGSQRPDVVIVSNPHLNPALSQNMAICAADGIPMIVDLDTDFENLPVIHQDYSTKGLGTISNSRAYAASLLLANLITVPSEPLADLIRASGYSAAVAPEGWDRRILQQQKLVTARHEIYFGWIGTTGLLEDLAMIRRAIIRVLHEFENTKVVIIGNAQAYQLFGSVPQNRKIFLPHTSQGEYLSLLDQLDILLVPLRTHLYNHSQSDKVLLQAGIKSIPWIASSIPAFASWGAGGIIANSRDEWHTFLRQLIMDPNLRNTLGKEGFQAASKREIKRLGNMWVSMIEQTLERDHPSVKR